MKPKAMSSVGNLTKVLHEPVDIAVEEQTPVVLRGQQTHDVEAIYEITRARELIFSIRNLGCTQRILFRIPPVNGGLSCRTVEACLQVYVCRHQLKYPDPRICGCKRSLTVDVDASIDGSRQATRAQALPANFWFRWSLTLKYVTPTPKKSRTTAARGRIGTSIVRK